jgi:hypothetical protein
MSDQVQQSTPTTTTNAPSVTWTNDDKVELPVSQFITMLTSFEEYEDIVSHINDIDDMTNESQPPASYLVQELKINGETHQRQNHVSFTCEFRLHVLVDKYITCPLLFEENTLVVHDATVHKLALNNDQRQQQQIQSNNKDGFMQVLPNYFDNVSSQKLPDEKHGGQIGIVDGKHSLITNEKGLYSVSLSVSVPFVSTQRKAVKIRFPSIAARNKLKDFKIEGDMQVQVEPSSYIQTEVVVKKGKESASELDHDDDDEDLDDSIDTHVTIVEECIFPSTGSLNIYWTRNEVKVQKPESAEQETAQVEPEEKEEQKPLIVNVDQNTLHSVGGGIISTSVDFNFQILNGSYDTFYIAINNAKNAKTVRILRVEGRNVKKWEVKKYKTSQLQRNGSEASVSLTSPSPVVSNNATQQQQLQDDASTEQTVIKVILDCGVDGDYKLKLQAEVDMEKESAKVHIPTFSCLNVNREKGFIGIEATSSVEIKEISSRLLTKVDTRELPSDITAKASDQLIFGHKFLQSKGTTLYVDVKKHDDVAVLVAVIEEAYYEVTYSESGHFFYHVILKVKNTTQDYVKFRLVSVPEDIQNKITTSLWATTVSGKSMRPAKDKEGNILLPLKRSAEENIFTIELFYLYSNTPQQIMKESGSIELYFPTFNTPITRAYYALYVPEDFNYGEFEGDLKECKYFGTSPTVLYQLSSDKQVGIPQQAPRVQSQSRYNAYSNVMPTQMQMQQPQMQMQQQQMYNAPQPRLRRARSFSGEEEELPINAYDSESDEDDDDEDDNDERSVRSDDEDDMEDFDRRSSTVVKTQSSSVLGVLPVALNGVTSGKQFLFEKLLVSETEPSLHLSVSYRQVHKSWREKRSLFPLKEIVYGSILAFILLLVMYLYRIRV